MKPVDLVECTFTPTEIPPGETRTLNVFFPSAGRIERFVFASADDANMVVNAIKLGGRPVNIGSSPPLRWFSPSGSRGASLVGGFVSAGEEVVVQVLNKGRAAGTVSGTVFYQSKVSP